MNTALKPGRLVVLAGTVAVAALALAGCDAAGTTNTPAASGSPSVSGGGLAADVASLQQPLSEWPIPTDPVSKKDALKGKTVYYIPVTLQAPQFGVTQAGVTAALTALGATVQVCDGQGTPTTITACLTQATQAGAAVIISDAIAYGLGANGFDAAQAAGIPVIIGDQEADPAHPDSKTLATVAGPVGDAMDVALAKWIIVDSGAKADVLVNQSQDGPSPAAFFASAQKIYSSDCPDCKITINGVTSGNFPLVAPSTSAALLKDPGIDYLEVQFGQFLQPSIGGAQAAGVKGKVKIVTGASQLGELQAVKSGDVAAASGDSAAFEGWVFADAALRLAAGDKLPDYTIPVRLFTADNIGSVDLSAEAMNSGAWYGPANGFVDGFKKLWGVN